MLSNGFTDKKTFGSKLLKDKNKFEEVLKQKFFYVPSSEIYGGVAGLYDMGPVGAALESQIVDIWRKHFIIEDSMLEIRSCQLTPYAAFKASGHVDKFSDVLVNDNVTNESYRADHLVKADDKISASRKEAIEKLMPLIESMNKKELKETIQEFHIKSPNGNSLSDPIEFNLMFSTSIGPSANLPGFLRPETAQGIFVNFKRLLDYNNNRVPFAAAQVGFSFRNEISPRAGLLRCRYVFISIREFLMAEIEHFLHPDKKFHPKFDAVEHIEINLFSSKDQLENKSPVKTILSKAIKDKIIANDVIGYYIGRTYLFLEKIGIDTQRIRFRQHLPDEKSHYACDCWDCEIHSHHGWIECIGIADRTCFDLSQHEIHSGQNMKFTELLKTPIKITIPDIFLDKSLIGKHFKHDSKRVIAYLTSLNTEEALKMKKELSKGPYEVCIDGKPFYITDSMVSSVKIVEKDIHSKEHYPHVVEPSFGIGRILYSLLSHTCLYREQDEQRIWFDFPTNVAPIKCVILPLSSKSEFQPIIKKIIERLSKKSISYKVDDLNTSIGRRYARADELGIPYALTIDFDTLNNKPESVTVRERNSTKQVRIEIDEIDHVMESLVRLDIDWDRLVQKYGLFEGQLTTI